MTPQAVLGETTLDTFLINRRERRADQMGRDATELATARFRPPHPSCPSTVVDETTTKPSEDAMSKVRAAISARTYEVDPQAVAEAILRRAKMLRLARRQLANESGRSRPSSVR